MNWVHRGSWSFEVVAVALAASGALSCGDDEPARDQAVLWLQLGAMLGQTCSSAETFNVPDTSARDTIRSSTGAGQRLVDGAGGSFVTCTVSEAAGGQYNLQVELSSGAIGNFDLRGSIANGQGTFDLNFNTTSFALEQRGCTGTARQALAGAVWISDLTCPNLVDRSSLGVACTGTGGLIAENCAR
jgi:hypothetical protein